MVKTRWIVITGAPCSGKSTVIDYLKKCNFQVVSEVAQDYIDEQKKLGLKPWETDLQKFQDEIYTRQLKAEQDLLNSNQAENVIFIDRALPDAWAYFHYHGLKGIPSLNLNHQYDQVLLFDKPKLNIHHDIDGDDPERLVKDLKRTYSDLGYTLKQIPVMNVHVRVMHILQTCGLSECLGQLETSKVSQDQQVQDMYPKGFYSLLPLTRQSVHPESNEAHDEKAPRKNLGLE